MRITSHTRLNRHETMRLSTVSMLPPTVCCVWIWLGPIPCLIQSSWLLYFVKLEKERESESVCVCVALVVRKKRRWRRQWCGPQVWYSMFKLWYIHEYIAWTISFSRSPFPTHTQTHIHQYSPAHSRSCRVIPFVCNRPFVYWQTGQKKKLDIDVEKCDCTKWSFPRARYLNSNKLITQHIIRQSYAICLTHSF